MGIVQDGQPKFYPFPPNSSAFDPGAAHRLPFQVVEPPSLPAAAMGRKVIHVDMDCFYAAVEERENPALRGHPLGVGGATSGRGVLTTCNYAARAFGVHSAMPAFMARARCPQITIVPTRFALYRALLAERLPYYPVRHAFRRISARRPLADGCRCARPFQRVPRNRSADARTVRCSAASRPSQAAMTRPTRGLPRRASACRAWKSQ